MSSETPLPHDPYPTEEGVRHGGPHPITHYSSNQHSHQQYHPSTAAVGRPIPLVQAQVGGITRHQSPLQASRQLQPPASGQVISRAVISSNGSFYTVYNGASGVPMGGGHHQQHRSALPTLSSVVTGGQMPPTMAHQPMQPSAPLMYHPHPAQGVAPIAAVQQPPVVYQQIPASRRPVQALFGM
jgi:hypothetical protein